MPQHLASLPIAGLDVVRFLDLLAYHLQIEDDLASNLHLIDCLHYCNFPPIVLLFTLLFLFELLRLLSRFTHQVAHQCLSDSEPSSDVLLRHVILSVGSDNVLLIFG